MKVNQGPGNVTCLMDRKHGGPAGRASCDRMAHMTKAVRLFLVRTEKANKQTSTSSSLTIARRLRRGRWGMFSLSWYISLVQCQLEFNNNISKIAQCRSSLTDTSCYIVLAPPPPSNTQTPTKLTNLSLLNPRPLSSRCPY